MFQFTHPRGVRLDKEDAAALIDGVSIHAPTRGATHRGHLQSTAPLMFQFTHPRGVRRIKPDTAQNYLCFNSRTHAGCDIYLPQIKRHSYTVSIHAPTRGATSSVLVVQSLLTSFNSRTHAGCDLPAFILGDNPDKFQFTHPRGVRHRYALWAHVNDCFNSRTHAGCDL